MKRCLIAMLLISLLIVQLAVPVSADDAEPQKLIALTFEDGPGPMTGELLDQLRMREVVATFFVSYDLGSSTGAAYYPELLETMFEDGHQVGNHTSSHTDLRTLTEDQIREDLESVNRLLYAAAGGEYQVLLRTPGGALNETVANCADAPIITWSVDAGDLEKGANADSVRNNIVRKAFDGGIILVHDTSQAGIQGTLQAVDDLREKGYAFVTVSELMRRRGVAMENGKEYALAYNQGTNLPAYSAPSVDCAYETGYALVSFAVDGEDLELRYTIDGSYPMLSSTRYEGPVQITEKTVINAAGFDRYGIRTPIRYAEYVPGFALMPYVVSNENGTVALATDEPGAKIYYTLNGRLPSTGSIEYTGPFAPASTTRAISVSPDRIPSRDMQFFATGMGTVYTDVYENDWFADTVATASDQGWMNGTGNFLFEPETPVTRAMMVTVLFRMDKGSSEQEAAPFVDVPADAWYADAIGWAYKNGIVNGISDVEFAPEATITREQMAAILQRYAAYKGLNTTSEKTLDGFVDMNEISEYAVGSLAWCNEQGLITGMTEDTLSPQGTASRAQCATVLCRLKKLIDAWPRAVPEPEQQDPEPAEIPPVPEQSDDASQVPAEKENYTDQGDETDPEESVEKDNEEKPADTETDADTADVP